MSTRNATRAASWMLNRVEPSKDGEERRFLDGFLGRLGLPPATVEKTECPDFFVQFTSHSRLVTVGCEIVRYDSMTDGPTRIEHGQRWRRFALRLRGELRRNGLPPSGTIHLRKNSSDSFDAMLRHEERAISEICHCLARNTENRSVDAFDAATEPTLVVAVERLGVHPRDDESALWWCASLQSGSLEEPWPILSDLVTRKNEKARTWDWRSSDERWLIIVAEAQTLGDTMVLDHGERGTTPLVSIHADAFTRVFAWDGFMERIHQIHPTFGLVFKVDDGGGSTVHRRMYPPVVVDCSPLLRDARRG